MANLEDFLNEYGLGIWTNRRGEKIFTNEWESNGKVSTLSGVNFIIKDRKLFKEKFSVDEKYDIVFELYKENFSVKILAILKESARLEDYRIKIAPIGTYLTGEVKLKRALEGLRTVEGLNINEGKMMETFVPGSWITKKEQEINGIKKELRKDKQINEKLLEFLKEVHENFAERG